METQRVTLPVWKGHQGSFDVSSRTKSSTSRKISQTQENDMCSFGWKELNLGPRTLSLILLPILVICGFKSPNRNGHDSWLQSSVNDTLVLLALKRDTKLFDKLGLQTKTFLVMAGGGDNGPPLGCWYWKDRSASGNRLTGHKFQGTEWVAAWRHQWLWAFLLHTCWSQNSTTMKLNKTNHSAGHLCCAIKCAVPQDMINLIVVWILPRITSSCSRVFSCALPLAFSPTLDTSTENPPAKQTSQETKPTTSQSSGDRTWPEIQEENSWWDKNRARQVHCLWCQHEWWPTLNPPKFSLVLLAPNVINWENTADLCRSFWEQPQNFLVFFGQGTGQRSHGEKCSTCWQGTETHPWCIHRGTGWVQRTNLCKTAKNGGWLWQPGTWGHGARMFSQGYFTWTKFGEEKWSWNSAASLWGATGRPDVVRLSDQKKF